MEWLILGEATHGTSLFLKCDTDLCKELRHAMAASFLQAVALAGALFLVCWPVFFVIV